MDRRVLAMVWLLGPALGCSTETTGDEAGLDVRDRVVDHGDGTYHLLRIDDGPVPDIHEHGVVWRYIGQQRFRHVVTPALQVADRVTEQPELNGRASALMVNTRFDEHGQRWLALDPDARAVLVHEGDTFGNHSFLGGFQPVSRLCFEVETAWIGHPTANEIGGGDYWRTNEPRPPIGATVYVEQTSSVAVHNLDDEGCVSFTTPIDPYTVTIESQGEVEGIDIQSYTDWHPFFSGCWPDPLNHQLGPCTPTIVSSGNFRHATRTYAYDGPQLHTETLSAADEANSIAWHPYVLMAYAMSRSTMGLGDAGNTSSCGAAGVPCCGHSDWAAKNNHDDISPTTLVSYTHVKGKGFASNWAEQGQVNDGVRRAYGYGSLFSGGTTSNDSIVALGSGVLDKWPMAHELGHMLVMLRTGARTETNYGAALYECSGQYANGNLSNPSDSDPDDDDDSPGKSSLSREFSSGAAREGWANFYAAQLFNDVDQNDCWMRSTHLMDFDLDGDIDNDYGPDYQWGVYSCETKGLDGLLGEPDPTDPLPPWLGARDWLATVWDQGACGDASSASQYIGRSSIYDWTRYFWDLATDENVPVESLADIYVDMCPTNWVAGPGAIPNDNWPELRLERSIDFHGYGSAHDAQKNNGVDHS